MFHSYIYDDGGRSLCGYKGSAGDCVTRSIAIATEKPYSEVYDDLFRLAKAYGAERRDKVARRIRGKNDASPRNGMWKQIYRPYLESLGWKWVPTMKIGTGCKVHLNEKELPSGRLIVSVSKHLTAVIDGVIHDTHDPSRGGTRCIYGYFIKA